MRDKLPTACPSVREVKKFLKRLTERELVVMGHGASLECLSPPLHNIPANDSASKLKDC